MKKHCTRLVSLKIKAKRTIAALVLTIAVVSVLAAHAQQSTDPRIADLVQSGRLRVALGLGSPVLAMKDANSGDVRGPALDLAQALAKRSVLSSSRSNTPGPELFWQVLRAMNGT